MCELDSAVFCHNNYSANTKKNQTHKKRQPVVISKSFYVQILSLCKVDYLRFAALMWTHVDHNFWIGTLQLLSGDMELTTSSTGFLSEILQRVSVWLLICCKR